MSSLLDVFSSSSKKYCILLTFAICRLIYSTIRVYHRSGSIFHRTTMFITLHRHKYRCFKWLCICIIFFVTTHVIFMFFLLGENRWNEKNGRYDGTYLFRFWFNSTFSRSSSFMKHMHTVHINIMLFVYAMTLGTFNLTANWLYFHSTTIEHLYHACCYIIAHPLGFVCFCASNYLFGKNQCLRSFSSSPYWVLSDIYHFWWCVFSFEEIICGENESTKTKRVETAASFMPN